MKSRVSWQQTEVASAKRAVGFIDLLDAGVLCNKVRRVRDDTANGTQVRENGRKTLS